jgi:hypothetical protein
LEQNGIPTALIVTSSFLPVVHVQRAALGMEALEPVVITHPLSTLSETEIEDRAREVLPQITNVLLSRKSSGDLEKVKPND